MNIGKYQWGDACRCFPGFKDTAGVVRLSWLLCELYRQDLGFAYPTRETLAERLSAPPVSVSRWTRALRESGAITSFPIARLSPEHRLAIGRRVSRGQVYILNFGWAQSVLEWRASQATIGNDAVTYMGDNTVTYMGNAGDTLIPYTDTLEDTLKEKGAPKGSESSAYAQAKGRAA